MRVVLADDHELILEGLQSLFRGEPDIEVVGRCTSGEAALRDVRRLRPDILVLDVRMPPPNGLDVLRAIHQEDLPTQVVILTAGLEDDEVFEAVSLGARGVVLKEMAPRLLVQCLRKVHLGGAWVEQQSAGRVLQRIVRRENAASQLAGVLTPRELEVVRMVARGLRNKEIADRLSIAEGTVKVHLHNTYEKLHLDGRLELTLYAQEKGLV
jgi:two-component system, NarL family, nitrate/nitrite response regulator NarL